jgi:hypothetical protein
MDVHIDHDLFRAGPYTSGRNQYQMAILNDDAEEMNVVHVGGSCQSFFSFTTQYQLNNI